MYRQLRTTACVALLLAAAAAQTEGQEWKTVTQNRQVDGEKSLRVNVEYAAGELTLGAGERGTLYRANMRYDASAFSSSMRYTPGTLRVGLDGSVKGRNLKSGSLALHLSPDVPVDLNLEFGAAEAKLDLGGLSISSASIATGASWTSLTVSRPNRIQCERLTIKVGAAQLNATGLGNLNTRRLSLEGGVGEMTLDFTGAWKNDMDARVEMGLGALTLRVPKSVGLSVHKDGLLASFDSQGLVKRGNTYYSENWDSAGHKLTVDLNAALGSIRVIWVD